MAFAFAKINGFWLTTKIVSSEHINYWKGSGELQNASVSFGLQHTRVCSSASCFFKSATSSLRSSLVCLRAIFTSSRWRTRSSFSSSKTSFVLFLVDSVLRPLCNKISKHWHFSNNSLTAARFWTTTCLVPVWGWGEGWGKQCGTLHRHFYTSSPNLP